MNRYLVSNMLGKFKNVMRGYLYKRYEVAVVTTHEPVVLKKLKKNFENDFYSKKSNYSLNNWIIVLVKMVGYEMDKL